MAQWPLKQTLPLHVLSQGMDIWLSIHAFLFEMFTLQRAAGLSYVGSHIYRALLHALLNRTLFHANEHQWAWSQSFLISETTHAATLWHCFCSNYSCAFLCFFINEQRHSRLNSQRYLGVWLLLKSLENVSIRHSVTRSWNNTGDLRGVCSWFTRSLGGWRNSVSVFWGRGRITQCLKSEQAGWGYKFYFPGLHLTLWMTLNKSHHSTSVCFHSVCLCLTGLGGSAFMFIDSLVWAFRKGLDVYVPFVTLTSSASLNMPILEITRRKQQ